MDLYGWTALQLFDNQNLIRGKFKIPFYSNEIHSLDLIN